MKHTIVHRNEYDFMAPYNYSSYMITVCAYDVHCTMYAVHCTVYAVQCTMHAVHYTAYDRIVYDVYVVRPCAYIHYTTYIERRTISY